MPKIIWTGTEGSEQARGARLDAGVMGIYFVRKDQPTQYIDTGGHAIHDAPTYNTQEGKVAVEYIFEDGRNKAREIQLSGTTVKSIQFNLRLPQKAISVTDRLYQTQDNCDYDVIFLPKDCSDGCDAFFWVGEEARLDERQITSAIIGYDDQDVAIDSTRNLRVSGQLKSYYGLTQNTLTARTGTGTTIHDVIVLDIACQGCSCPNQTIVRAGDKFVELSEDGGRTWTPFLTSGITVVAAGGAQFTSLAYVGGFLIASYTDVAAGTGTEGGVAYVFGLTPGATMIDATFDSASDGVNSLAVYGSKVYAFGTAGRIDQSCDYGRNWTELTSSITEDILESVVDRSTGNIALACSDAGAYVFNDGIITSLTTILNATAATDLLSVALVRPGSFIWGGADGNTYEIQNYEGILSDVVTASLGSSGVTAFATDEKGFRIFAFVGDELIQRSPFTEGDWAVWEDYKGGSTTINAVAKGKDLKNEGSNYFILGAANATTVSLASCGYCIEAGC